MSKYTLTRYIGLSSDGRALVEVNNISRRLIVTPLFSATQTNQYNSFGCSYARCPFPDATCNRCELNYEHQIITKRK